MADQPLRRADGRAPYEHQVQPSEIWMARDHLPKWRNTLAAEFSIEILALQDGRYCTTCSVDAIRRGHDITGRPVTFATRTAAIRTSAARMLRWLRHAPHNGCYPEFADGAQHQRATDLINWALRTVAAQTNGTPPRRHKRPAPPNRPTPTGLPLFDLIGD